MDTAAPDCMCSLCTDAGPTLWGCLHALHLNHLALCIWGSLFNVRVQNQDPGLSAMLQAQLMKRRL